VKNDPFAYEGNFEAAAREWRYEWFVSLVKEYGYRGILVAHHEDDLIETYFMQEEKNLVPSWYGLKEEMMYQGVLVKRPLLSRTKKELLEYCEKRGIRYFIDSTNADESLSRNRIRRQIVEPLSRMERDMIRREIDMKNAEASERSCRVGTMIHEGRVSLAKYRALSEADRLALLRKVIETDKHFSLSFVKQTDQVLMKKNDFDLPVNDLHLVQEDGSFFMVKPSEPYAYTFSSLEEIMQFKEKAPFAVEEGKPGVNAVTVSEQDFPLTIRSPLPSDSITLRFGTKKIHRFFIDRHIPLYKRRIWPVVTDRQGRIILVPGLGCDISHFSISPDFNVLQY
jgi:tRNA(Ile)-lysidine synthase